MPRGQNLYFKIYTVVRKIPRGQVATYGQVAALIGRPRGAQMVGWALRALPEKTNVPWQRVINKAGMISIENLDNPKERQAELLKQEGIDVVVRDGNYFIDLKKFGWMPVK